MQESEANIKANKNYSELSVYKEEDFFLISHNIFPQKKLIILYTAY